MIVRVPVLVVALATAATAAAQSTTSDRAKAFTLDSIAPAATPTPEASATPAAPGDALRPSFTIETPIAALIADPAARAVLDRDLPGLTTDDNLDKFAKLGLREFQPLTGGQLTDAMLVKVARDLATLAGPMVAPIAPGKGGTSKRDRDASR